MISISLINKNDIAVVNAEDIEVNALDCIEIINDDTGEKVEPMISYFSCNTTETTPTNNNFIKKLFARERSFEKDVTLKFELPPLATGNQSMDGSRTYGDFYAYLKINYTEGGTTSSPTIKVTSINGYWKYNGNLSTRFDNREVVLHQGRWLFDGYNLYKTPGTNSFNYQTGWGFTDKVPVTSSSGVMALSSAKAVIEGMGNGYTMQVTFTY